MNKLKELWQYPVFRWCVYQTPLLVFMLMFKGGALDFYNGSSYEFEGRSWGPVKLRDWALIFWILIFILPAVWVWRKPIWKAIGFLNKKADEE